MANEYPSPEHEQEDAWHPFVPGGRDGAAFGGLVEDLRNFLDTITAAKADEATLRALAGSLRSLSDGLAPLAVPEPEQVFARRLDLPGRGSPLIPPYVIEDSDRHSLRGRVSFGRFFLGGHGAAHGGIIATLFDDVLGRIAHSSGRARARTAYLRTDFRSIAPLDTELRFHGWIVSEEGRKRLTRGELRHGDTLCAEAEALFIILKPGAP